MPVTIFSPFLVDFFLLVDVVERCVELLQSFILCLVLPRLLLATDIVGGGIFDGLLLLMRMDRRSGVALGLEIRVSLLCLVVTLDVVALMILFLVVDELLELLSVFISMMSLLVDVVDELLLELEVLLFSPLLVDTLSLSCVDKDESSIVSITSLVVSDC